MITHWEPNTDKGMYGRHHLCPLNLKAPAEILDPLRNNVNGTVSMGVLSTWQLLLRTSWLLPDLNPALHMFHRPVSQQPVSTESVLSILHPQMPLLTIVSSGPR